MAKVWVYCWDHVRGGRNASWGHSSVQIEGGAYISWWPSEDEDRNYLVDKDKSPRLASFLERVIGTSNVYKVKHRCNPSYQHDVMDEGRGADETCEIAPGVLDTDAISKWWKGYAYESASYHTIKKNCSTTVIRALRAGGSDQHVSVTKLGRRGRIPRIDFLSKQTGWEPTDITSYLRLLNRALGDAKVNLTASKSGGIGNKPVESTGVRMCEAHGQPLLTCNMC
ncbi:hypothetical protein [Roseococcus sp. YIM B11640]|uniref:hypothetical protein n=1 Tax=Roseococcus sp. YIM B11640 TaxID=3133973 RepID=UPI003C7D98A6